MLSELRTLHSDHMTTKIPPNHTTTVYSSMPYRANAGDNKQQSLLWPLARHTTQATIWCNTHSMVQSASVLGSDAQCTSNTCVVVLSAGHHTVCKAPEYLPHGTYLVDLVVLSCPKSFANPSPDFLFDKRLLACHVMAGIVRLCLLVLLHLLAVHC